MDTKCYVSYARIPAIQLCRSLRLLQVPCRGTGKKLSTAGFTAYLTKPVSLAHLRDEVQRLLSKSANSAQS